MPKLLCDDIKKVPRLGVWIMCYGKHLVAILATAGLVCLKY